MTRGKATPAPATTSQNSAWWGLLIAALAFLVTIVAIGTRLMPMFVAGNSVPAVMALLWWAAVGACIGSFLNVVVYRWPAGKSIVRPRSYCPLCGHDIRGRDNLPVVGWLALGGRCRDCRALISIRYPLVELLTALVFVLMLVPYWGGTEYWIFRYSVYTGRAVVLGSSIFYAALAIHVVLACSLLVASLVRRDGNRVPFLLWGLAPLTAFVALLLVNPRDLQIIVAPVAAVVAMFVARRQAADVEPRWPCWLMLCGSMPLIEGSIAMLLGLGLALIAWRWISFLRKNGFGWLDAVLVTVVAMTAGEPLILRLTRALGRNDLLWVLLVAAAVFFGTACAAWLRWRRRAEPYIASVGSA